jgi:putative flippase GtrA
MRLYDIADALPADRGGTAVIRRLLHAQVTRFALTGAFVAAVYFAVTTGLAVLAGAPTQLAVIVGYLCSLAVHFTANRQFVFASSGGYAHHLSAQGSRYILVALCSYSCTALLVALAERADLPELLVALVVPILFAAVTFFTLRSWVFQAPAAKTD